MKQVSIPSGMKDLVLDDAIAKRELQAIFEKSFDMSGYQEVITPMLEYYETYTRGFTQLNETDLYKFLDADGRIVSLRADMTVPIARVCATKFKDSSLPLRFRYCASVFKAHEQLSGLQSEINDCGVELIGSDETIGDLEILVLGLESLLQISEDFRLEIGNITYFMSACTALNLTRENREYLANYIGNKQLVDLEKYIDTLDLDDVYKTFFLNLAWLHGGEECFLKAKELAFNDELLKIVDDLETLYKELKVLGYQDKVLLDFGKLANLDYYTGLIFDAYMQDVGVRVLSGGRYDNLLSKFGKNLPAVGFSVKLESLLSNYKVKKRRERILRFPESKKLEAIQYAKELRQEGPVSLILDNRIDEFVIEEGE